MKTDYRHLARTALARAKTELDANDDARLRYAALELRNVLEALTYDRAQAFKDELPPEQYKAWQPRKLMKALIEFDPSLDSPVTIAVGIQDDPATPAPPERMTVLGTDNPITSQNVRDHYDALSSYLHVPTPQSKERDGAKLRARCGEIVIFSETILSSRVWNSTLGNVVTLPECVKCKKPINKKVPLGSKPISAQCLECNAEYEITENDQGDVIFIPQMRPVRCGNKDCKHRTLLWLDELKPGKEWQCEQ